MAFARSPMQGGPPPGMPENPTCKKALEVAVASLRYMGQHNVADWCERPLKKKKS